MEHHPGAFLTLSQSNGIGFHSNIPVSELIKHITRAIVARDVASTPPVVKTMDRATVAKGADP